MSTRSTLTRKIEEALKELNATLPHNIKADQLVFRQANFIETSIRNVQTVLLEAFVVVAVVLFLFLMNWRTTLISLTAIPASILITAVVFYFAGLSINTMTLGGIAIAIGELVDDAVVGRREHLPAAARESRARQSTLGIRRRGQRLAGGALRHRLRHDDHRAGVRAAVRADRHRGQAVRAARRRLHRLDPGEPRGVDHADAGHGLLHAAGPEEPGRA